MKIALVQCPVWAINSPPLTVASLTAYIRKKGYEVFPLDFNIKFSKKGRYNIFKILLNKHFLNKSIFFRNLVLKLNKRFILDCEEKILKTEAEVIGFVCYRTSILFSLILAKRLKEKNKVVIFGGSGCSEEILGKLDFVDFIVHGEGEKALEHILNSLKKNKKPKIKNFPLLDLNTLPFPEFSDFDLKKYGSLLSFPISGSRGCIKKCSFCTDTNYWIRFRSKSAKRIFEEINVLKTKYGITGIFFTDSLINGNLEELKKLCEFLIKNKTNISWEANAIIRKDMSSGLFKNLKKAGCKRLCYGVESFSPTVLKKMRKPCNNPEEIEKIIQSTKNAGIMVYINLITGFPTETWKDFFKNFKFIFRNRNFIDSISIYLCYLLEGSHVYNKPKEYGIYSMKFPPIFWKSKNVNFFTKSLRTLSLYCFVKILDIPTKLK